MSANRVFYSFLEVVYPQLSKAFRKKGEDIYETYISLNKAGHKFIFNLKTSTITHLFYQSTFDGYEYGKKLVSEMFKVLETDRGVTINKVAV